MPEIFIRAKAFSDFLGFHVRLLFCASIAGVAAAIPISNLLTQWQAGQPYSVSQNPLELAVMLVFASYAATMFVFIIGCGWAYIGRGTTNSLFRKSWNGFAYVAFTLLESGAIAAILYFSMLQILGLFDVEWRQAVCTANAYLSQTNYPFTPVKPAYCLSISTEH